MTTLKTLLVALALTARSAEAGGSHSSGGWKDHVDAYADTGSCYGGGKYNCALDEQACYLQSSSASWLDHTTTKTCDIRATAETGTGVDKVQPVDVVQYDPPVSKNTFGSAQVWTDYSCSGHGFQKASYGGGTVAATPVLSSTQCSGDGVCAASATVTTTTVSSSITFTDDDKTTCDAAADKTWLAFAGAVTYTADTKNKVELADASDEGGASVAVVAGMAVIGDNIPDYTFVSSVTGNVVTLTTIVASRSTSTHVNGDTTAAIPAATALKFYPTQVVKAPSAKFGSCYSSTTHAVTVVYDNTCPAGAGNFYAHGEVVSGGPGGSITMGEYTYDEVPIGFCYSSDGLGPELQVAAPATPAPRVAIPGGGYCALSALACDYDQSPSTSCNHGVVYNGQALKATMSQAQCETYNGVCGAGTVMHNHMSFTDDAEADCGAGKLWIPFPNVAAGATSLPAGAYASIPGWTTTQSFKTAGDSLNPGCFLTDLIGSPVATGTPADSAGFASSPDATALGALGASAALLSAILA